jgi:cytochrome P450
MSWVRRVRKQLDEVCGHNAERLPQWGDFEKLTMVHATIKEVMRWGAHTLATGFPHALTEDTSFEGYNFQHGTVFSWNYYHISMSDEEFENAREFRPERYLNEQVYDVLSGNLGFGIGSFLSREADQGRRVCVGYLVAARNMFIVFSRLLYCFDFFEEPV